MPDDRFDVLVLGAGLRGLAASLRCRQERPTQRLALVESAPQPGGRTRTQRSNGFACELGAFAFSASEVEPLLARLHHAPAVLEALPTAQQGSLFTGTTLTPVDVEPAPLSFRTGAEELAQACRRELGPILQLGRAATAIDLVDGVFVVTLGGEVPHRIIATELVLALPELGAGRLLGRFDPALADAAGRARTTRRAFVFLGGNRQEAPPLRGYGVLPGDDVDTPMAEVIHCTEVFDHRALPGRFLVRCEVAGPSADGDDEQILTIAAHELRRWTGFVAPFPFTKVHRFEEPALDGTLVECRVRLQELGRRVPGLSLV